MAQIDFLSRLGAVIGERDVLKVALTMNKGQICSHTRMGILRQMFNRPPSQAYSLM